MAAAEAVAVEAKDEGGAAVAETTTEGVAMASEDLKINPASVQVCVCGRGYAVWQSLYVFRWCAREVLTFGGDSIAAANIKTTTNTTAALPPHYHHSPSPQPRPTTW